MGCSGVIRELLEATTCLGPPRTPFVWIGRRKDDCLSLRLQLRK